MDKFIPNAKCVAVRTLWKPISKDFVPNAGLICHEINLKTLRPWNKLKGSEATCMEIAAKIRKCFRLKDMLESCLKLFFYCFGYMYIASLPKS